MAEIRGPADKGTGVIKSAMHIYDANDRLTDLASPLDAAGNKTRNRCSTPPALTLPS